MTTTVLLLLLADLPDLQAMPGVASVKVTVACNDPKQTIIHVRDWHFVEKKSFIVDVRDESDEDLADAEVDELFEQHRRDVAAVQKQQLRFLRALIPKLGIKQVFHESFGAEELPQYNEFIDVLRNFKRYLPTGDSGLDQFTRYQYATDLLQIGAPGQLLIDGHIKAVVPAEDSKAFEAANPVQTDGRIVFDVQANKAREDAIVTNIMKAKGRIAILVLGSAHDLSDNVPDGVKLIELTVKRFGKLSDTPDGSMG